MFFFSVLNERVHMIKAAHYQNKIVLIFGPAHALGCCRFPKKSKFQDNFFFFKHLSSYVLLACFLSHLVFYIDIKLLLFGRLL